MRVPPSNFHKFWLRCQSKCYTLLYEYGTTDIHVVWRMDEDDEQKGTKREREEVVDSERSAKKAKVETRQEPVKDEDDLSQLYAYETIFSVLVPPTTGQKITPILVKAELEKKLMEVKKLKKQVGDLKLHESALVMRLMTKEQEIHRLQTELQDMKSQFTRTHKEMREVMLDRTLNMLFQRMKEQLKDIKQKLKQNQEDLSAATFTRESAAGRQLLNKIRLLQKENEDLGQQLWEGNIHKLELEISVQKEYGEEVKKNLDESNEFVLQLDEELEKMYATKQI